MPRTAHLFALLAMLPAFCAHAGDDASHPSASPAAGSFKLRAEPAANQLMFVGATTTVELPPPSGEAVPANPEFPPPVARGDDVYPIDLATAVHLAGSESLSVALAREQWREASFRVRQAESLWLPSIRVGLNYNKHEGVIQDVRGTAFPTSRGAFFSGLGAGAVGAGSPSYPGLVAQFHLADAIFQPSAARQAAASRRGGVSVAMNDALLEAALAYTDLLGRAQETALAVVVRDEARRLVEATEIFARTGAGTLADAERARTALLLRETAVAHAEEAYGVARARLAQVLRLEPTLRFVPADDQVAPLELIPADLPAAELVARGLSSRPELAEQRHLVAAAAERLRRERCAVLVPSILIGTSYGGFGAGLGSSIAGYGDRFDFDAVAYWEVRNLGAGDRAARGVAQSQLRQASLRQLAAMDQVAREIVEAHARVESRRAQIAAAREAVPAAESSYRRNLERIRGGEGLPIESLQAMDALATSQIQYVRAVTDYNAAQFTLQRALGWPIDAPEPAASVESPDSPASEPGS